MTKFDILYFPFPEYLRGHYGGFVSYSNGRFRIIIDRSQSEEFQQRTLKHEYGHIMLGHVLSHDPEPDYDSPEYDAREAEADAYADNMPDSEYDLLLSLSRKKYLDTLPEGMPEQLPEVIPA